MPLVLMTRDPDLLGNRELRPVVHELRKLVAEALTVPDSGVLTPDDIEVLVQDFGPLDVHAKNVEIFVWAHDYPERLQNLDERQLYITEGVKRLFPLGTRGFVWILLQPTSFGEFQTL